MSSSTDALLGCVAAVLLFGSAWSFSDKLPFRSEVTVYRINCMKDKVDGQCPGRETTSYTITFRADPLQQSVIYWSDNGTPSRFHNCAIRDAKNWKCTSKQPFFDVDHEMLDGEFAEYNSSTREPLLRGLGRSSKVPKWKWWATWLVDEISKNN